MNAVSTVETASVVDPNTSVSIRVQSISRISPEAPDRKKQASTTTRMGRGLYHRGSRSDRVGLRRLSRLSPSREVRNPPRVPNQYQRVTSR